MDGYIFHFLRLLHTSGKATICEWCPFPRLGKWSSSPETQQAWIQITFHYQRSQRCPTLPWEPGQKPELFGVYHGVLSRVEKRLLKWTFNLFLKPFFSSSSEASRQKQSFVSSLLLSSAPLCYQTTTGFLPQLPLSYFKYPLNELVMIFTVSVIIISIIKDYKKYTNMLESGYLWVVGLRVLLIFHFSVQIFCNNV